MTYNVAWLGNGQMKAIARLRGASYSPQTVQAMLEAFDAAWALVHFHFYESPDCYEVARLRLANTILRAADEGNRDVEQLTAAGLASMGAFYRLEPGDFGAEAIMPQRVNNPRYWQNYAEETRTMAEQMKDPECKRLLVGVAETYAELARRAVAPEASRTDNDARE
jgi:hypothetical protein